MTKNTGLEWKFIKSVSNKFIDIILFCDGKFWSRNLSLNVLALFCDLRSSHKKLIM